MAERINKIDNRNSTVTLIRVFSMVMILICHTIEYYTFIPGSSHLDQIFTVGVHVFFIISGFLYGSKEITDFKSWYIKRIQRVCIPVFILVAIDVLCLRLIAGEHIDILTFLYFFFNIHGLTYLLYLNNLPMIQSLVIIWFSSVMMVCYLLVPLLQKLRAKILQSKNPKRVVMIIFIIGVVVQFPILYYQICDPRTLFIFAMGYFLGMLKFDEKNTKTLNMLIYGFITILLQGLRVIIKMKIDNAAFQDAYRMISHYALGLFIVYFFFYLKKLFPVLIDKLAANKLMLYVDGLSYYIFLCHGVFCKGTEFNVFEKFDNLAVSIVLFIVLSVISAIVLKFVTDSINKAINKVIWKNK